MSDKKRDKMSDKKRDKLCEDFGFCGCGMPEEALLYMRSVMQALKDRSDAWAANDKEAADRANKHRDTFFQSLGQEYTIYYLLEDKGMTEHGGSVPGWLDAYGESVLDDLNEFFDE